MGGWKRGVKFQSLWEHIQGDIHHFLIIFYIGITELHVESLQGTSGGYLRYRDGVVITENIPRVSPNFQDSPKPALRRELFSKF